MKRAAAWTVALLVVWLAAASPAVGHDRTTSYSTWDIRGRTARVTARLTLLDASRFPWFAAADAEAMLRRYVGQHLVLLADHQPCAVVAEPQSLAAPPGRLLYEWSVSCPPAGALSIRSDLLLEIAPSHLHFARVTRDGAALDEHLFSEANRTWSLGETSTEIGRAHV